MKPIAVRRLACAAMVMYAILLGACGGGSSTSAPTASAVSNATKASHTTALVRLKFVVPKKAMSAKARSAQYVSTSTTSLTTTITPAGGSAQSPIYVACTATCDATFQAPTGSDGIALKLTDGVNGSGNQLSLSTTTVTVVANANNQFNLTANPVVSSVAVQLGSVPASTASTNAGAAADTPVTVKAMDADGNTIVGPGNFVDVNGNPVTLTLSVANAQAGGSGTVTLSQTSFTAPPSTPVTAHYDGNWLDHATISASASSALTGSIMSASLTTVPQVTEYPVNGGPFGIIAAPDGNMWFAEYSSGMIGKIHTDGTGYTEYSCAPCNGPRYSALGSDGDLWFNEFTSHYASKISLSGTVTRVASVGTQPTEIVAGPDGNLWMPYVNGVDQISTAGVVTPFPTGNDTRALALGPDDNFWVVNRVTTHLLQLSLSGVYSIKYTIPGASISGRADGLVTGPDGNLWYTNEHANLIQRLGIGGGVTPYTLQTGANPTYIVVGPDGYLWFTESGTAGVARLSTAGALTEYGAANGISPVSGPAGITVGPDGNIWFTENSVNKIAKLVL